MKASLKKAVGASALGALSVVELLHLQQATAAPATFTGSTFANPHGGSVQVAITVDGASGTYKITSISTPVQPTGSNASYANYAIPTLTSEALAAQSATITAVSGASQISAAWINSLSSAIAAAAAGGQPVGQASVVVAPTPTATGGTPAPGTTTVSGGGTPGGPLTPVATAIPTSVAQVPIYYPFYAPPFSGGSSANLTQYFNNVSTAINRIAAAGDNVTPTLIAAAQNALAQLQTQVNQSSGSSAALAAYIANANAGMQYFMNQGNQAISDYYAKVVAAASQLYVDAQASAAAIKAEPAPTVTVTVTATPKPTETPWNIKPGGVIKKTFTCVKKVGTVTTTKVVKAFIVQCPTGFTLLKK
jgi:uncharacterized protein with FMN-binding domain